MRASMATNGLDASVWSNDIEGAKAIASRMECGTTWINRHAAIEPNAPMGASSVQVSESNLARKGWPSTPRSRCLPADRVNGCRNPHVRYGIMLRADVR